MRTTPGGAAAYRKNHVLGSTPEQLVPLLYGRLLTSLRRADTQIEVRDIAGKAESLEKASDIVFELLGSLDFEAGGEIANRLGALYAWFAREIIDIGLTLDRARLARVVDLVAMLHEAWVEAAERVARDPLSADGSPA